MIAASLPAPAATRPVEFINGIKDTLPMIVGAIPFAILFGALGTNAGLSPAAVAGMSLFVFAGSAQFIASGLVQQNISLVVIIITTLIVNLRHALYAASLAPYMKHLGQTWLLPLAFWLTDETYAIVIRRYARLEEAAPYKHWYHLGSAVAMYVNWQVFTWVGMFAGSQLQGLATWGLEFAMVVTFIGIVVPIIRTRPMLVCAVVAGGVAVLLNDLPNKAGLLLAAFAGIVAGMLLEQAAPPDSSRSATL
ncbi:MAG: AzlC family ABC transporter permease [Anaerolineae bacterium]|jgi:4-azaleucine resistance transporter AzlC|nr:AzlC family ABC transporter permease [Anaerolineae bacterium]